MKTPVMTGLDFRRALRTDLQYRYTSVGGYPVYLIMRDGECMCQKCAHEEKGRIHQAALEPAYGTGWEPLAVDVNWEDPYLRCCNCNERIESAYAEKE